MVQKSDTGSLANIASEMMTSIRFTMEHSAPMIGLVAKYNLKKGHDTAVFPKVGQMSLSALEEGEDMIDEEDIGLTTSSVTTEEVGGKIIITKRLLARIAAGATSNIWTPVGEQFGDAAARKMDTDLLGLASALNSGTDMGLAGAACSAANVMSVIGTAKTDKFGSDLRFVVHPQALLRLGRDLHTIGSGNNRPLPAGFSKDVLDKFWTGIQLGGVTFWEDGNITRDASDDAINLIFNKNALGILISEEMTKDKTWDASRRAWEMVLVRDYKVFELDDSLGSMVTFDAADTAVS